MKDARLKLEKPSFDRFNQRCDRRKVSSVR